MFEQELYESETLAPATQPGDLFHNYEIKNWNFTGRIYKILALSAIGNILALMVIGTSGVLTARGCDSPFVGRVCQVLDTVYVGALIFGTESEYADVDYTKTELEDADVTFVDVTGVTPPLSYPEGYFQLANPEQQFTNLTDPNSAGSAFLAPGIPANPTIGGSGLINTPPVAPPVNDNPIVGDLGSGGPLGPSTDNPTTSGRKGRGRRGPLAGQTPADPNANTNVPNANSSNPTVAENVDEAKQDQNGVYINKRPLKDKAPDSLEKIEKEVIKIETPFKVTIAATLGPGKDGKTIVLKNPKPVPTETSTNDPEMVKFVQDWIIAVGDAGWFGYLARIEPKPKNLIITVEQNDVDLIATVKADQPSENQAKTQASSLGLLLNASLLIAKGDEQAFLQKASVTSEGKAFVLNFKIPKPEVKDMVMRKLAESRDKQGKPEGSAFIRPNDNTARK
jgi:hypothetical protein